MNTQVSFLDGTYSLIHIPLDLYPSLFQPIIRVLLPQSNPGQASSELPDGDFEVLPSKGNHGFLNISITPIECSIVCHRTWAERIFEPAIKNLPKEAARSITISKDVYMVLSVISAGLDPAGRVMELTSPLALAGISIFFISTYYSDFILVPAKERQNVTKALIAKGFELSDNKSDFTTPVPHGHKRTGSAGSPPNTPPPANIAELQSRAFELLKKRNVTPHVDSKLELAQCSGRETSQLSGEFSHSSHTGRGNGHSKQSWLSGLDTKLYLCIVSALASQPRFISITLAHEDPPSLLLDKELLAVFGDAVVGDTDGVQIPIFLDLVNLPFEVTGIVCGVAGRLVQEMQMAASSELSYLSTARAGAVILPEEHSKRALETLRPLLSKDV